jgi:hypothetical protein
MRRFLQMAAVSSIEAESGSGLGTTYGCALAY